MSKKSIIVIVIVLGLIIVGGWFYFSNYQIPIFTPGSPEETVPEPKEEIPPVHILSDRADVSSVGGGGGIYPTFIKQLIIDPAYEVKEGEEQYFSIWVKDPTGIERATAIVKTDKEDGIIKTVIELRLVEGTAEEGRWEGSWITEDIPARDVTLYYLTDFWVINKDAGERKFTSSWYSKN